MNKESSLFWEKALPLALMDAVRDPSKWGDTLELIMEMSGAKAAIITLRDKQTCQIVNDLELEQKYHSPLIRGFPMDAIVHYLTHLRTADPWADFQRTYYPHRPLQMSRVCPRESVPDQRFFTWLADLGFRDSVVFELDRVAGHWTAMNLFLEDSDSPASRRVIDFSHEYSELIRNAWVSSQALLQSRQSNQALLDRAAAAGTPICVVGANGELLESNSLFDSLTEDDTIRVSARTREISFARSVRIFGLQRWAQTDLLRHDGKTTDVVLFARRIDPDPIFAGKRESHWVLTSSGTRPADPGLPDHLNALTRQERDLYDHIASGKSVEEAGQAINLKRSRSFEVWAEVKSKLGIRSAHQLRR